MTAVLTRRRRTPRNGSIGSSGLRLIDRRRGLGARDLTERPARAAAMLSQKRSIRVMMIETFLAAPQRVPTARAPVIIHLAPRGDPDREVRGVQSGASQRPAPSPPNTPLRTRHRR
ncbi:hypothetical protein GCM10028787_20340 [Brachybacterium horti]